MDAPDLTPREHQPRRAALIAAAHRVRSDPRRFSRLTFRMSLVAVQAVTICLAVVSLSNVALLGSIVG